VVSCPLRSSSFSSYGTEDYCWLRVDNFFILRYVKGADLSTQVQQLQQLWNLCCALCTSTCVIFTCTRVPDPHQFNADPGPVFHSDADHDADPAFHFNADPDPDPDPPPHQSDANLRPLVYRAYIPPL
jgi:hypothetical protein